MDQLAAWQPFQTKSLQPLYHEALLGQSQVYDALVWDGNRQSSGLHSQLRQQEQLDNFKARWEQLRDDLLFVVEIAMTNHYMTYDSRSPTGARSGKNIMTLNLTMLLFLFLY